MTLWANDTVGNLNSTTISWDYRVLENSVTYSNTTMSGTLETIYFNSTYSSDYSAITVLLNYDETNYTMSSSDTGYTREYNYELIAPQVSLEENKTFYFIISLSNETDTVQIITNS